MKIDWMVTILALCGVFVLVSFWKAHRTPDFNFNAFDLIMENGRVSRTAVAFMVTFAVSTWVVVHREIVGTLNDGFFGLYLVTWASPVIAKLVFNKSDTTVERVSP